MPGEIMPNSYMVPQDPHEKLKGAGFTTGQAIAINHVTATRLKEAHAHAENIVEEMRKEMRAAIKQDRDNANVGRYIVTVALCAALALGFALGKVFA